MANVDKPTGHRVMPVYHTETLPDSASVSFSDFPHLLEINVPTYKQKRQGQIISSAVDASGIAASSHKNVLIVGSH